jgi:hypothetical protein
LLINKELIEREALSIHLNWKENLSPAAWDALLASIGGHPLQSALWGESRKVIYNIKDKRWAAYHEEKLVALIRFEQRGVSIVKKIAWIPQGPAMSLGFSWGEVEKSFLAKLKSQGMFIGLTYPWARAIPELATDVSRYTVWLDLSVGKEMLWKNLDKQWRYGARRAQRLGIQVSTTNEKEEVESFYKLCQCISAKKNFKLNGSIDFFLQLLRGGVDQGVGAKLFLAKYEGKICAGALVLYSGKNLHYLWGGVDRHYAKERAGEFIQWSVIEWACDNGFELYDLEGIDEANNPGVAAFKKKMGGEVVGLLGRRVYPLNWCGKMLSRFVMG